ncbi:MAG: ATP-dependent Clp protease proteolytic subunit [Fimbriiglobus sp.]|nr:ATP-dependent Clp protease proteolytic subunit [Fimbriiglobus sp.]
MFFPPTDPRGSAVPPAPHGTAPFTPVMQSGYMWQRERTPEQLLLDNRIIFLGSSRENGGDPTISDFVANLTIQKLLWLATDKKTADIHLYINSPGGSISAGLAIYDAMQFIGCPVHTYCMGMSASMAAVLLAAGTKGKRYALPNSKMLIHQPRVGEGVYGQVTDLEIYADEIQRMKARMNEILARHTGRTVAEIEAATDRDRYMTAEEAKAFGLVDEVLVRPTDGKK